MGRLRSRKRQSGRPTKNLLLKCGYTCIQCMAVIVYLVIPDARRPAVAAARNSSNSVLRFELIKLKWNWFSILESPRKVTTTDCMENGCCTKRLIGHPSTNLNFTSFKLSVPAGLQYIKNCLPHRFADHESDGGPWR